LAAPEEPPAPAVRAVRLPWAPGVVVLVIGGPITRAGVAGLCDRARSLLAGSRNRVVVCDVRAVGEPDAATVDALARLQLMARRMGKEIRLRDACADLRSLLRLAGLAEAIPPLAGLPLEPGREPEEGEQPAGVEEERDPADPGP
jgi:ABC-type transporter Mla MlaB component